MSDIVLIVTVLISFIFLLLSGLYLNSVLLAIGAFGLIFLEGFSSLKGFLGSAPFTSSASYTLTTIPLFVLMAQFILQSGIVKDIFDVAHRLSRGRSTVLGVMTIIAGGFLGAVSGSGTATSSALGQAAIPELKQYGYKSGLAGSIAAIGGSLSSIIPPSIALILYGVITQTAVGDLFIAATVPGVLLMVVFAITLVIIYRYDRTKTAENEEATAEKVELSTYRVTIAIIVSIFIIIVIFGGIYSGIMTPTEAGGVGAFAAFIAAGALGKINLKFIKVSIVETIKVNVMVMLIFIGANVFGKFISLSLFPRKLENLIAPLLEFPFIVLIIIGIFFFIMFMFLEAAAVILMSLPVLLPIIESIHVDVIWFGVFTALLATIGMITPPVGLSVYGVSGPMKIPSESIFRYTMIFAIVATIVVGGIMILFPEITAWLPSYIN